MKKVIAVLLFAILSTGTALAVDNDGTSDKSNVNILCHYFKIACTKVDNDGTNGKVDNDGTSGKSRPHGDDQGTPPDNFRATNSDGSFRDNDVPLRSTTDFS